MSDKHQPFVLTSEVGSLHIKAAHHPELKLQAYLMPDSGDLLVGMSVAGASSNVVTLLLTRSQAAELSNVIERVKTADTGPTPLGSLSCVTAEVEQITLEG